MKRHLLIVLIAGSAAALTWCGGDKSPVTPTPVPTGPEVLTTLRITGVTQQLDVNQTSQLTATATFNTGTSRDVTAQTTWRSFNTNIATVSATGLLTAVSLGRTGVQATYQTRSAGIEVLVLPPGTFILRGTVAEPVNVPLVGARIEVIDGPHAGRSATASPSYEIYGLSGDVRVRATSGGYFAETKAVSMTENRVLNFELRPTTPPIQVSGSYSLTFAASSTCASRLLEDARARTYDALIRQDGARLLVELVGSQFAVEPRTGTGNHFTGTIRGDTVTFAVADYYYYYYYYSFNVVERLVDPRWVPPQLGSTYLTIAGTASGRLTPSSVFSTSLAGSFGLWEAPNGFYSARRSSASCSAPNHQFTLARR